MKKVIIKTVIIGDPVKNCMKSIGNKSFKTTREIVLNSVMEILQKDRNDNTKLERLIKREMSFAAEKEHKRYNFLFDGMIVDEMTKLSNNEYGKVCSKFWGCLIDSKMTVQKELNDKKL